MKRLKLIAFVATLTSFLFSCEEPDYQEPVNPTSNSKIQIKSVFPEDGATDISIPHGSKYIWDSTRSTGWRNGEESGPGYKTRIFKVKANISYFRGHVHVDSNSISLQLFKNGEEIPGNTVIKREEMSHINNDTLVFTPKNALDFGTTYEAVLTSPGREYQWSFTTRKKWEIKRKEVKVGPNYIVMSDEVHYQLSHLSIVDGDLYVAGYYKAPDPGRNYSIVINLRAFKIRDGRIIWEYIGTGLAYKEDYDKPDNEWANAIVEGDMCIFSFWDCFPESSNGFKSGSLAGISKDGVVKWSRRPTDYINETIEVDKDGWVLIQDTYYIRRFNPTTGAMPRSKSIFIGGDLDVIDFWVSESIGLVMFGRYDKYGKNPGFVLWTLDRRWLIDFPLTQEFTHAEAIPNGRLAYLINENTGDIQARKFTSNYTEDIWEKSFPISKVKSTSTDEERNLYIINKVGSAYHHQYKLMKITEEGKLVFETDFGRNLPMPEMKIADWPNLPTQMEGNVIFITWWDKILRFDAGTGEKLY